MSSSPTDSENKQATWLARPFAALRPSAESAARIAAPPYDVINVVEAREIAAKQTETFLRVSRPDLEFDDNTDAYSAAVYARAKKNLASLHQQQLLIRETAPAYYVYRITGPQHVQTGIAFAASVDAYDQGAIKKHELTRPKKETDRVHQIEAVAAHTGPVLLTHRSNSALAAQLEQLCAQQAPLLEADVQGWTHSIWQVGEAATIKRLSELLNQLPAFYIADGHHRSAAASRVAASRKASATNSSAAFLAVSFSEEQMRILDYNRVVRDLGDYDTDGFLRALEQHFEISSHDCAVKPAAPQHFGLYVDRQWYQLRISSPINKSDPIESLDVHLLDHRILRPLLGIEDPRTDERIDFIGGSRGTAAIEARVDSGEMRVGFTLHPTPMQALMAVADAGRIMPPKSTWFEPKLADGLLSLPLDG